MTYIKEVILENFMSYRYSRISLEKGLNIITGPNGSGKSSILLGISVALGQTYTERGRRLGDLVRKGEDIARVTVVFDNSRKDEKKPFPWFRTDEVYFTRYVRRDGEYWHEVNGRVTPKVEVIRYLSRVGINPNNMMIMHQNMIEQFIYLSPQEKLKTVEDVMGLRIYRERIVSSLEDLKNIQEEEKVLKGSLENAREQFEYWNTLYSKYLKKLELEEKLKNLTAEKYWRLVHEKRLELDMINKKLKGLEDRIKNIRDKIEKETLYKNRILEEITDIENEILLRNKNLERLLNNLRVKWMEYADKHAEISQDNVILSYMIKELTNFDRFSKENEYGITLVSLNKEFKKKFEPYSAPFSDRINSLKFLHNKGLKTWVSIEPYPTPNLDPDAYNIEKLLNGIKFVDKIIFGKLNYNVESNKFESNEEFYKECARKVIAFCKKHGIKYHIKEGTPYSTNKTKKIFEPSKKSFLERWIK